MPAPETTQEIIEALSAYAKHTRGCRSRWGLGSCSCGLYETLGRARKVVEILKAEAAAVDEIQGHIDQIEEWARKRNLIY